MRSHGFMGQCTFSPLVVSQGQICETHKWGLGPDSITAYFKLMAAALVEQT